MRRIIAIGISAALLVAGIVLAHFGWMHAWGWLTLVWIVLALLAIHFNRGDIGRLWLLQISRAEFGQSDVQLNYTRTYAWMANQLGHMTLGMGTALAYVWLVEGLGGMLADVWLSLVPEGRACATEAGRAACELIGHQASAVVALLLMAGILWVMLTMLAGLENSDMDLAEGAPRRYPEQRWPAALFTVTLTIGTILVVDPTLLGLLALGSPDAAVYTPERVAAIVRAIGVAAVSLSIWWTKEFGNDQRGVRVAISRAAHLRGPGCPARTAVAQLQREAIWDSVADGFFYLTGAFIAVGVVASAPDLSTPFAESAWELTSVVIFGAAMLWLGQRYAYRARAIDLIGVPYAFRLGLVESRVAVLAGEALLPEAGCPVDRLHAAMTRDDVRAAAHFIVIGPAGSGKTPLVVSLACEAALARIAVDLWTKEVLPNEVKVRYTSYRDAPIHAREARFVEADDPVALRNRYRTGLPDPVYVEGELLWDLAGAHLVVVDNIPLRALLGPAGFEPRPRLRRLMQALAQGHRRVIWAIDPPREDDALVYAEGVTSGWPLEYTREGAGALAARFAAELGALDGSAAAICLEVTDDRDRRAAMMERLRSVRAPEVRP